MLIDEKIFTVPRSLVPQRSNTSQTLRAVTFRQIIKDNMDVDNDEFKVDHIDVSAVTCVGRIVSIQEKSNRTLYMVDDGTGKIELSQWSNANDEEKPDVRVGSYIRAYGNLKSVDCKDGSRKTFINAYNVKPVHDHNEVMYHFYQCIAQHLQLTKGSPPSVPSASPAPVKREATAGAPAAPAMNSGGNINEDMMAIYNDPEIIASQPSGVHIDEVYNMLYFNLNCTENNLSDHSYLQVYNMLYFNLNCAENNLSNHSHLQVYNMLYFNLNCTENNLSDHSYLQVYNMLYFNLNCAENNLSNHSHLQVYNMLYFNLNCAENNLSDHSYLQVYNMLKKQGSKYTTQQIREAAEILCNEGILFSSTDDFTYKSASAE
eukprot:gene18014-24424_t